MRCLHLILPILLILSAAVTVRADTSSEIKFGILASLSDEWAEEGDNIVKGAQLAADEVNSSGGIDGKKIALVTQDTREANSGAKALAAYKQLRLQGISYFVGPAGTPAAMSLAPIIAKEPVVIVTPLVGVRDFSNSGSNIFNSRGVDDAGSRLMAHYAVDHGWKKASVLASQQAWENAQGHAFKDEFEKLGGKVVDLEEPLPDTLDLKTPVTKALTNKPDVVFMSNANRMPLAAKELSNLGYKGPRLTTLIDNSMIQQANGQLEGAIFATFGKPSEEFVKKFAAKFGRNPGLAADTAYDAVLAISQALRGAKSAEVGDIAKLLATGVVSGASGDFSFDQHRVANRTLSKFTIHQSSVKQIS